MEIIINTTQHIVRAKNIKGEIIEFQSIATPLRCIQILGEERPPIIDCPVVKSGSYSLDISSTDPDLYKDATVLIVSTIVANAASTIRDHLKKEIRILVPDSGPTAQRDEKGLVHHVLKFIEY